MKQSSSLKLQVPKKTAARQAAAPRKKSISKRKRKKGGEALQQEPLQEMPMSESGERSETAEPPEKNFFFYFAI